MNNTTLFSNLFCFQAKERNRVLKKQMKKDTHYKLATEKKSDMKPFVVKLQEGSGLNHLVTPIFTNEYAREWGRDFEAENFEKFTWL